MHFRKNIRLREYDYSSAGYYFITICTKLNMKLFAPLISAKYGHELPQDAAAGPWSARCVSNSKVIEEKLLNAEKKFPSRVDFYCIMPNHLHVILYLPKQKLITVEKVNQECSSNPIKLCWIVNAFKGWCTRALGCSMFQPNFYEHIIRNEMSLERIREYIRNNPYAINLEWQELDV